MASLTPQEKAERTYNLTADFFDDPVLGFWERSGRRTVELLELQLGMRVLDVCCGTGASALPAAEIVGVEGRVVAEDGRQEFRSPEDFWKVALGSGLRGRGLLRIFFHLNIRVAVCVPGVACGMHAEAFVEGAGGGSGVAPDAGRGAGFCQGHGVFQQEGTVAFALVCLERCKFSELPDAIPFEEGDHGNGFVIDEDCEMGARGVVVEFYVVNG